MVDVVVVIITDIIGVIVVVVVIVIITHLVVDGSHGFALIIDGDALNGGFRVRNSFVVVIRLQVPDVNGTGLISYQQFT